MARSLDKKKEFGEVFGGGRIRYEQDGVLFDVHGDEIVEEGAQEQPPAGDKGKGKGKGKQADQEQADAAQQALLDEQLAAQADLTQ